MLKVTISIVTSNLSEDMWWVDKRVNSHNIPVVCWQYLWWVSIAILLKLILVQQDLRDRYGISFKFLSVSLVEKPKKKFITFKCKVITCIEMIPWKLKNSVTFSKVLTHWGWVTHICFNNLTIIGSDKGLVPDWHQTIIWTNAGILLTEHLGTNFSEILIKIHTFSFQNMHLKVPSGKWRQFYLGLNVLTQNCMHNSWDTFYGNTWGEVTSWEHTGQYQWSPACIDP